MCDVLDHDDVKITEFVVIDSIVAGSNLTKNVTCEVSPIAADQEAMRETNHGDIVKGADGIYSPFHTKDSPFPLISHI